MKCILGDGQILSVLQDNLVSILIPSVNVPRVNISLDFSCAIRDSKPRRVVRNRLRADPSGATALTQKEESAWDNFDALRYGSVPNLPPMQPRTATAGENDAAPLARAVTRSRQEQQDAAAWAASVPFSHFFSVGEAPAAAADGRPQPRGRQPRGRARSSGGSRGVVRAAPASSSSASSSSSARAVEDTRGDGLPGLGNIDEHVDLLSSEELSDGVSPENLLPAGEGELSAQAERRVPGDGPVNDGAGAGEGVGDDGTTVTALGRLSIASVDHLQSSRPPASKGRVTVSHGDGTSSRGPEHPADGDGQVLGDDGRAVDASVIGPPQPSPQASSRSRRRAQNAIRHRGGRSERGRRSSSSSSEERFHASVPRTADAWQTHLRWMTVADGGSADEGVSSSTVGRAQDGGAGSGEAASAASPASSGAGTRLASKRAFLDPSNPRSPFMPWAVSATNEVLLGSPRQQVRKAARATRSAKNKALSGTDVIVTIKRITHRKGDFVKTLPREWVNDELTNAYGELIMMREAVWMAEEGRQRRLICLSSHLYSYLMSGARAAYNFPAVARWTKKVQDVFSLESIMVPVNLHNAHWMLAIVHPASSSIEIFDSLGVPDANIGKQLSRWASDEAKSRKVSPRKWTVSEEKCRQQENGDDCGVMVAKFMDYLSQGKALKEMKGSLRCYRRRMAAELLCGALM